MAYFTIPRINGKEYEWTDIKVNISGLLAIGITELNFEQKQSKVNLWGAGAEPVAYGNGNKEATGSMTLYFGELQNLRNASPNGQIVDLAPLLIITLFNAIFIFVYKKGQLTLQEASLLLFGFELF